MVYKRGELFDYEGDGGLHMYIGSEDEEELDGAARMRMDREGVDEDDVTVPEPMSDRNPRLIGNKEKKDGEEEEVESQPNSKKTKKTVRIPELKTLDESYLAAADFWNKR